MSELIINSKLATAGPGHFELQEYPLTGNCMKKLAVSNRIGTQDQKNCNYRAYCSTTKTKKQDLKIDNEFVICMIQIELMTQEFQKFENFQKCLKPKNSQKFQKFGKYLRFQKSWKFQKHFKYLQLLQLQIFNSRIQDFFKIG